MNTDNNKNEEMMNDIRKSIDSLFSKLSKPRNKNKDN